MFKYTYKTRGFSIGCQPNDFTRFEEGEHKFETIYYDRELTKKEIEDYELVDLNLDKNKTYKINIEEVLSKVIEIEANTEEEAMQKVLYLWEDEEIILDYNDFQGYPNIRITK